MSLVSVIIPCHNAAPFLRQTLASAFAQRGVELQVILIDDGSTDASGEIVTREFPMVEYIRTAHLGASHARNAGLHAARGEFIQFLDADDMLVENKLPRQIAELEKTGADVVYGDWQYLMNGKNGEPVPGPIVANELRGAPELELLRGFFVAFHAYVFRRPIVERVGAFRTDLPIIQDARFVLDCALHGAHFVYVPGVAGLYRMHGNQISRRRAEFVQDCLRSAQQVEEWWRARDGISPARHAALVQVYGNIARMSYAVDRATFFNAYRAVLKLEPRYAPSAPRALHVLARVLGYPRAEAIAARYRQAKHAWLTAIGRAPKEPLHANAPR